VLRLEAKGLAGRETYRCPLCCGGAFLVAALPFMLSGLPSLPDVTTRSFIRGYYFGANATQMLFWLSALVFADAGTLVTRQLAQ
jgi:hypothetical protein